MSDYNAGDRKQVREAEKRAKLFNRQRMEFIRTSLTTEQGRRFFWNILEVCHIFQLSYAGDEVNVIFREGERSIGLYILNDIMAICPEKFVEMMQEHNAPIKFDDDEKEEEGDLADG